MSQAGFPLFQLPQQSTTLPLGDVLNTPTVSRERAHPLLGSTLESASSLSPDNTLLSSASISFFSDPNLSTSTSLSNFSPGTPQPHAYTQLVRQYQQSQDDLKKTQEEYGRLK
jgi:hypothetical protein